MNFNVVNVVMFGAGAILIYSAIKDKNPKDVISDAFTNSAAKPASKDGFGSTGTSGPQTANGSGPAPSGNDAPQFGAPYTSRPVVTSN